MPNIQGSAPKTGFVLRQSTFVSCKKRFQESVCSSMNAHPTLSIETATQLAVFLVNRPGALARACDALANAGINIYARWLHQIL